MTKLRLLFVECEIYSTSILKLAVHISTTLCDTAISVSEARGYIHLLQQYLRTNYVHTS